MAVTQVSEADVLAVLAPVKDPELGRPMMELKMIQDVAVIDPQTIGMRVVLTTPACPMKNRIHDDIDAALATLPGSPKAQIKWDAQVSRTGGVPQKQQVEGVKNKRFPLCVKNSPERVLQLALAAHIVDVNNMQTARAQDVSDVMVRGEQLLLTIHNILHFGKSVLRQGFILHR